MVTKTITVETLPRGPEERYRIYARKGLKLRELASCPDPAGIGAALIQLHEDAKAVGGRLADEGMIGVLDGEQHEWIILPFTRGWTKPDS